MGITKLSKSGFTSSSYEKYNDFLAGNTAFSPSSYESIATVTVGSGGSSTVTFSSIPATYTHLQIRGLGRSTNAVTDENLVIQFNSDTANNYNLHNVYGNGSTVGANATVNYASSYFSRVTGGSSSANIFGAFVVDILDYANTNKYKTNRSLSGHDQNGSGYMTLMSGAWRSTSAITSITIKVDSAGANIAQYSQFALYGVKS
jgi:hypothetical protein